MRVRKGMQPNVGSGTSVFDLDHELQMELDGRPISRDSTDCPKKAEFIDRLLGKSEFERETVQVSLSIPQSDPQQ